MKKIKDEAKRSSLELLVLLVQAKPGPDGFADSFKTIYKKKQKDKE